MCTFYSTGYMCKACGSCVRLETSEKPCANSKSENESVREKCVPKTIHKRKTVPKDECYKCREKKNAKL
ncbi:hypothetical protein CDV31_009206 [Fusarium ambrosium]|uniref:Uncharacterized protein n=1 Tax=Fusarium ambrosium TaxID=131363 RepID=A0A428TWI3_9HYPO|nr:hypothetical protein CDV31_009206 [Fusarium ambrosium]